MKPMTEAELRAAFPQAPKVVTVPMHKIIGGYVAKNAHAQMIHAPDCPCEDCTMNALNNKDDNAA